MVSNKRSNVNESIRANTVLLIDEEGNNLGKIKKYDALAKAREAGLDLVEVSPKGPVCRLMDYGKWKFDQSKKERKNKASTHKKALKEMKFRPNTGDNDLKYRAKRAAEFIEQGHRLKLVVRFRGREQEHMYETGKMLLEKFVQMLEGTEFVIQDNAKREGAAIILMLSPSDKK